MESLLVILLVVSPVFSNDGKAVDQDSPVPMNIGVGGSSFDEEVESTYAKIRRLIWESRAKKQVRRISEAIANRDPESAQKELDTLVRECPELKKQEPQAIEYHQGNINFWRGDFKGAYEQFNNAIKTIEQEYPNGLPRGDKYSDRNIFFMGQLYFSRGATLLHQQKYEQAIQDFNKAMLVSQPRAYILVNKCRAFIRLKKYKEASDAFTAAYKVNAERTIGSDDSEEICTILKKNGFQPQPCLSKKPM